VQFAVGEVDEHAAGIQRIAVAEHLKARTGGERREVGFRHVQARDQNRTGCTCPARR